MNVWSIEEVVSNDARTQMALTTVTASQVMACPQTITCVQVSACRKQYVTVNFKCIS